MNSFSDEFIRKNINCSKYFDTIIQSVKENHKVVNDIETRDGLYRWQKSLPSVRMSGIFDDQLTRNFLAFFLHSHRANGPSFLHEGDSILAISRRSNLFLSSREIERFLLDFISTVTTRGRKRLSFLKFNDFKPL